MMKENFYDLLTEARNLLYQKKHLYIKVTAAAVDRSAGRNAAIGVPFSLYMKTPQIVTLDTEYKDTYHGAKLDIEYEFLYSDLEDGSEVDRVANIPASMKEKDKMALRLAYILYDGTKYVNNCMDPAGNYEKDALSKGWCSRVTKINASPM